jgi:hypothetical protein
MAAKCGHGNSDIRRLETAKIKSMRHRKIQFITLQTK